jgi:hypothetical protein
VVKDSFGEETTKEVENSGIPKPSLAIKSLIGVVFISGE